MIVVYNPKDHLHHTDWEHRFGKDKWKTRDTPARALSIRTALKKDSRFKFQTAHTFSENWIHDLHPYAKYLKHMSKVIKNKKKHIYADIFPGAGATFSQDLDSPFWIGRYSSDLVTPVMKNTFEAAKLSVDVALTGADLLRSKKEQMVYSLCRPPGHHAGPRVFGGYCYFNNAGIAAHYLSKKTKKRIALIDIDYHHGNGTQEIFERRSDVLTVSIHGDPEFEYPYFTGYKNEVGIGPGKGFNYNLPFPLKSKYSAYERCLVSAIKKIQQYDPSYIVVAAGFDAVDLDPVGQACLKVTSFKSIGYELGKMGIPVLACQEGGYNTKILGECVHQFLSGLLKGASAT